MPCRSTAFATRSARWVSTRFTRRASCVRCLCIVACDACRRTVAYLTSPDRTDRLLRVPRLASAPPGPGRAARVTRPLPAFRARSARGPRLVDPPQPRGCRQAAGLGARGREPDEGRPRARGRIRGRLRDGVRVAAHGESDRRGLLDRRHGGDPPHALEARWSRTATARVCGHRPAGAPPEAGVRPGSTRVRASTCVLLRGDRLQRVRGGGAPWLARAARIRRARRVHPVRRRRACVPA